MNQYLENVIDGFLRGYNVNGNPAKVNGKATFNASVDCGIFYSYDTPIARKEHRLVYVDTDYYSPTTSKQRNALIRECKSNGLQVIELVGTKIIP